MAGFQFPGLTWLVISFSFGIRWQVDLWAQHILKLTALSDALSFLVLMSSILLVWHVNVMTE